MTSPSWVTLRHSYIWITRAYRRRRISGSPHRFGLGVEPLRIAHLVDEFAERIDAGIVIVVTGIAQGINRAPDG